MDEQAHIICDIFTCIGQTIDLYPDDKHRLDDLTLAASDKLECTLWSMTLEHKMHLQDRALKIHGTNDNIEFDGLISKVIVVRRIETMVKICYEATLAAMYVSTFSAPSTPLFERAVEMPSHENKFSDVHFVDKISSPAVVRGTILNDNALQAVSLAVLIWDTALPYTVIIRYNFSIPEGCTVTVYRLARYGKLGCDSSGRGRDESFTDSFVKDGNLGAWHAVRSSLPVFKYWDLVLFLPEQPVAARPPTHEGFGDEDTKRIPKGFAQSHYIC
ncbi:uncharacterized protein CLUP02_16975 [Colletotrichum lupini]|uniref:Uncharacterized protein n=1 Tax=Colletotrichum lupini TaxID=145971 RepID=A0A9Q8T9E8_9PEZI|nr:uncharacterized protein CLUP02_16975 [Colletotrichum lupini]UQC91440.1 hypothetical protein CLUP02_16975 [Colletotrichum lupini]